MLRSLRSNPLRYRWLLWGMLSVSFLLVNLYRLSSAVLAEQLMIAFDTTGAQLGTLHASFFYIYAVMQIPSGILADRLGPRYTVTAGALVMNVGVLWFVATESYAAGFLARTLIGLGGSVIFISILRFCANWYRTTEFATMNGMTLAVSGVGGILATTPLALAVTAIGWRSTLGVLAGAGLVAGGVAFAVVRDSPEDAGLLSIDGVPRQATITFREAAGYAVDVFRDRFAWVIGVMLFCSTGLNLTLFGLWGVPYVVQTSGVSITYASAFTLAGSAGIVVGPPAIGRLSDRLERRTSLMIAGGVVYAAGLATIAVVGDPPLALVGIVFFVTGSLMGAFVLSYPIIKERHPASASGVAMGTINAAAFLGAAVLPTVMGWVLDTYWTGELVDGVRVYTQTGYRIAFGIAAGCGLVALCCTVWLHLRVDPSHQ